MIMMSNIPEDLCLQILLRVPGKSTFVCKCVCKTWFSLISDPDFARMYLNFNPHRNISGNLMVPVYGDKVTIYTIGYDTLEPSMWKTNEFTLSEVSYPYQSLSSYKVKLLGSCNGLVCLVFFKDQYSELFCLWNPATHEYKKITSKPSHPFRYHMCAFGYDSKNDDYKLVIGVNTGTITFVQFYTLRSDYWKSVQTIPYSFQYNGRTFGLLVNGRFHWLASDSMQRRLIVSLNISDEEFKEIELPIDILKNRHLFITEAMVDGCLSVLVCVGGGGGVDDDRGLVQVWVMQEYGIWKSWTKRYRITHEIITKGCYSLRYIRSFKNGEVLFMKNQGKLVLYDPKDGSVVEGDMSVSDIRFRDESNYFESLVSINSYLRKGLLEDQLKRKKLKRKDQLKLKRQKTKYRRMYHS